jgi:uncharacterized protein (TIGR00299 family) protein
LKTLHFDCFAGISGDMTLGAFVDLGVDPDELRRELGKLGLEGWKLELSRDERNGISGIRAVVQDEHGHHRREGGGGHSYPHEHRSWETIRTLIEKSALREGAKKRALDMFTRIAEAESQVHGIAVDEISFHEVGALDSIIDITGTAICLDMLKPERITASEIELGSGTVECAHGILPVPAPATALLLRGLPVKTGGFNREMTTPTGAAILAASVDAFLVSGKSSAVFREIRTGVGIGTRKLDKPNILRLSWREEDPALAPLWNTENLTLLEANIDDMTGEALGFLMERFFEAGALDVAFIPLLMKKSRPGTLVSVLGKPEKIDALRECFFLHSSAAGFREIPVSRLSLTRKETLIPGEFGTAREKTVFFGTNASGEEKPLRSKIEFEDRARVARELHISLEGAEKTIRGSNGGRK